MTLTQLKYMIAVSKEGNFRKAALSRFVTQPTLSAQLLKLEEELGVILFDRSKSPTVPTRIGRQIIEQAKVGLCEINKIAEIVKDEAGLIEGQLRVAIIPTISPYLTPLLLDSFCKKNPKVELIMYEAPTEECLKKLDREEVDIAVLGTQEDQKKYYQEHLYDEELFLFVNQDNKLFQKSNIRLTDIDAKDIWLLEDGHCLRNEIIEICKLRKEIDKRPAKIDFRVGALESLKYIVMENYGYTLIPKLAALRFSKNEKKNIRKFSELVPRRSINLTKRRKFLKRALIQEFSKEVSQVTQKFLEKSL